MICWSLTFQYAFLGDGLEDCLRVLQDDLAQSQQFVVFDPPHVVARPQSLQNIRRQVVDGRVVRVLRVPHIELVSVVNVPAYIPIGAGVRVRLAPARVEQHLAVDIHRLLHRMALGLLEPGTQRFHALDVAVHLGRWAAM